MTHKIAEIGKFITKLNRKAVIDVRLDINAKAHLATLWRFNGYNVFAWTRNDR